MPRSTRLEREYRSFLARFGLPPPSREVAEQVFAELRRGGREGMDSLSPDVSPEKLIGMMQASGSGMQFLVDHISEEIEKSIGRAGLHLNAEFFAGEFPTGSFNAQACLVSNGTLLLLNTGLMVFLHKASKLVSHSIRFAPFGSDGKPILGTEERDDKPDTLSY